MFIPIASTTILINIVLVITLSAGIFLFASILARSSQRWPIAVNAIAFTMVAALWALTALLVDAGAVAWLPSSLFGAAAVAYWYDLIRR